MSLGKIKVLSVAALIAVSGAVQAAVSQPMHVTIEYEYAKDGEIVSRKINGEMQRYEYDLRGQLTGVYDGNGKAVEAYTYDAAGNILKKTLNGTTTTFKYDAANQLVSKEDASGLIAYAYDAAGRMIREGDKEYRYSYLDKITSVIENGETAATMDYFVGGQLASVTRGNDAERFIWDGLALVHRDGNDYLNEPAIGGGNPVASDGKVMFNDRLGSTVAVKGDESYSMTFMTAFGESNDSGAFFTGKPFIGELGYAFLMRSYRPENGKWQTADPMGYPDGWNQLAYCNNHATSSVDLLGCTEGVVTTEVQGNPYITPQTRYETTTGERFLRNGYQDGVYGEFWRMSTWEWEVTEFWKNTPWYNSTWATVLDASSNIIAGSLGAAIGLYSIPTPITWTGATVGVLIGAGTGLVTWFVCTAVGPDPVRIDRELVNSGSQVTTRYIHDYTFTDVFRPIKE